MGLNLVYLVPGETGGMEVYARELVKAMRELPECPRLTAFVNRDGATLDWLEGIATQTVNVSARRSSRTTRPPPAISSVAARASIPMVSGVAIGGR